MNVREVQQKMFSNHFGLNKINSSTVSKDEKTEAAHGQTLLELQHSLAHPE